LDYWKEKTNIKLYHYVDQIKDKLFKKVFPLFLFHIEVITLILPPMKMEGLDARFQWYVKLANAISNRPKSQEDHQLQKLAESFPFTKPTTPQAVNATLWKFVAAWARKYRPRILLTVRKEKPKSGTGCYKLYQRNIL
jgi:hypothetical protein